MYKIVYSLSKIHNHDLGGIKGDVVSISQYIIPNDFRSELHAHPFLMMLDMFSEPI